MRQLLQETNAKEFVAYLSGGSNFRKLLCPDYKANRTQPDPRWLQDCKEFLLTEWSAKMMEFYEADDLLGINQTQDSIIVSLDKDLKMIPGEHYSWEIKTVKWTKPAEFTSVTEEQGIRTFYTQMLVGDRTDNVIGIAGLGPVKSKKYLSSAETEQDLFDLVYNKYDDPQRFLMNGVCLWICQEEGVTWAHHLKNSELIIPNELKPVVEATLESMKFFTKTT